MHAGAHLSSNSRASLRKAFRHFLQMKTISKLCSSGWSAVSWWHSAQSNHFLQHGERIETWAFRTCLLLRCQRRTAGAGAWLTTCWRWCVKGEGSLQPSDVVFGNCAVPVDHGCREKGSRNAAEHSAAGRLRYEPWTRGAAAMALTQTRRQTPRIRYSRRPQFRHGSARARPRALKHGRNDPTHQPAILAVGSILSTGTV